VTLFFFDFDDGNGNGIVLDDTGLEYPDASAASHAAMESLPGLAAEHPSSLATDHDFIVSVRDELGRSIFRAKLASTSEWLTQPLPKASKASGIMSPAQLSASRPTV
jgi:hypothetical protein